jgi:hypothetical protein
MVVHWCNIKEPKSMLRMICFATNLANQMKIFESLPLLSPCSYLQQRHCGKKVGKNSRHLTGQAYSDRHLAGQLTKNTRKMWNIHNLTNNGHCKPERKVEAKVTKTISTVLQIREFISCDNPQIANTQFFWLILKSQIRKFLWCSNAQIWNPPIFSPLEQGGWNSSLKHSVPGRPIDGKTC